MTPSMKLPLNGLMSCLLGHSQETFAAVYFYSVFSQTGECWGEDYRGGHTSGERGLIRDLQPEAVGPDGRIYLLLI